MTKPNNKVHRYSGFRRNKSSQNPAAEDGEEKMKSAAQQIKMNKQKQDNKKRLESHIGQRRRETNSEKLQKATAVAAAQAPKTLEDLIAQTERKQDDYNRLNDLVGRSNLTNVALLDSKQNKQSEYSLKSFYKEVKKVIDAADVVIEVLDARDPQGSRSAQVEEIINSSGRSKKLVLLLNKIDLVPKQNVLDWLKYLRKEYPTVAFKSSTQNQNTRLAQSNVPIDMAEENLMQSSVCLGADTLVKLLNNYTRVNDVKQTITVGIIGFPNVGKSSIINSLKRSHACQSGSTPGLTKCMQEIKLDKHIKLLDSPGIVMSKDENLASLALKNCVKIESMEDPTAPIELLVQRCSKEQLIEKYKIGDFSDAREFLFAIARRYGKLKKNDIADLGQAAHIVLNDWNNGKLTYFSPVPTNNTVIETKIVSELKPLFDLDALFKECDENVMNDNGVMDDEFMEEEVAEEDEAM